jgi:glucose uptake protein GlcU
MKIIICSISVILLVIGIVLTVAGYQKKDMDKEPKILTEHKKELKIIGPIVIVLAIGLASMCLMPSNSVTTGFGFDHHDDHDMSNFGFKFY